MRGGLGCSDENHLRITAAQGSLSDVGRGGLERRCWGEMGNANGIY
jgi:hypothetical protein